MALTDRQIFRLEKNSNPDVQDALDEIADLRSKVATETKRATEWEFLAHANERARLRDNEYLLKKIEDRDAQLRELQEVIQK